MEDNRITVTSSFGLNGALPQGEMCVDVEILIPLEERRIYEAAVAADWGRTPGRAARAFARHVLRELGLQASGITVVSSRSC